MVPVNATTGEFESPFLPVLLQKISEGIVDSWLWIIFTAVIPQNGWVQLCVVVAIFVGAHYQGKMMEERRRARHEMC